MEEEEEEAAAEARKASRRACVSSREEEEEDKREGGFLRVVRTDEGSFLTAYVRARKRVSVCTPSFSPGSDCALLVLFLGRSAAAAALGTEEPAESS